jgi:preprotein translocase SecF subunit
MLKPLFRLPQKMNLRFVKYFKLCLGLSIAAIIATTVLLSTVGLNFGIDFRGGTLMEIKTEGPADVAALRTKLSHLGIGEVQLQTFGAPDQILIRFAEQPGGPDAQKVAADKVRAALGPGVQERRTEQVGSTVSKELINSAIWALVLTNLVIFIYVWFRFEWQFALGAIVSLVHDVMFTVGVYAAFQLEFDLTTVAALLTILGYSINDTVVIYDRIRENLRRYKRMPLGELLDLSVNETMSRTIMTVGTVLMALMALYLFGGEVIRGFIFAMLFGVLVGTYSSVYVAAPFLIIIGVKRDWSGLDKGKARERGAVQASAAVPSASGATSAKSAAAAANDDISASAEPVAAQAPARAGAGAVSPAPSRANVQPGRAHGSHKGKAKAKSGGRSKRRG